MHMRHPASVLCLVHYRPFLLPCGVDGRKRTGGPRGIATISQLPEIHSSGCGRFSLTPVAHKEKATMQSLLFCIGKAAAAVQIWVFLGGTWAARLYLRGSSRAQELHCDAG